MNMDFSKERIPRKSGEDRGIDPEPAGNDRHRTGITYSQSGGQTESTTIFHDLSSDMRTRCIGTQYAANQQSDLMSTRCWLVGSQHRPQSEMERGAHGQDMTAVSQWFGLIARPYCTDSLGHPTTGVWPGIAGKCVRYRTSEHSICGQRVKKCRLNEAGARGSEPEDETEVHRQWEHNQQEVHGNSLPQLCRIGCCPTVAHPVFVPFSTKPTTNC